MSWYGARENSAGSAFAEFGLEGIPHPGCDLVRVAGKGVTRRDCVRDVGKGVRVGSAALLGICAICGSESGWGGGEVKVEF